MDLRAGPGMLATAGDWFFRQAYRRISSRSTRTRGTSHAIQCPGSTPNRSPIRTTAVSSVSVLSGLGGGTSAKRETEGKCAPRRIGLDLCPDAD